MSSFGLGKNNAIKRGEHRRGETQIKFLAIISAPEGIEAMQKAHPDIDLHLGIIDQQLNHDAYIVPGFGDAGDRLYQTEI